MEQKVLTNSLNTLIVSYIHFTSLHVSCPRLVYILNSVFIVAIFIYTIHVLILNRRITVCMSTILAPVQSVFVSSVRTTQISEILYFTFSILLLRRLLLLLFPPIFCCASSHLSTFHFFFFFFVISLLFTMSWSVRFHSQFCHV